MFSDSLSDDEIRAIVAKIEAGRPKAVQRFNPNDNPKLVEGRAKFIADVRAGKRPAPRTMGAARK